MLFKALLKSKDYAFGLPSRNASLHGDKNDCNGRKQRQKAFVQCSFDNAEVYEAGKAEEVMGQAFKVHPDQADVPLCKTSFNACLMNQRSQCKGSQMGQQVY